MKRKSMWAMQTHPIPNNSVIDALKALHHSIYGHMFLGFVACKWSTRWMVRTCCDGGEPK